MIENNYLFGIIDNGVLAFCAIKGIDIDKKFGGIGLNGAIYGALFGNSISDFLAGLGAYDWLSAFEITAGCLIVVPFVWIYYKLIWALY